jgi:hypothetical protein
MDDNDHYSGDDLTYGPWFWAAVAVVVIVGLVLLP